MSIPFNLIATGDDLGLTPSVNRAILHCFENGYINSTSLLTNTVHFEETVTLIHENSAIYNIGVHINLAEGRPLTKFDQPLYLDESGSWNLEKVSKKSNVLNAEAKRAFSAEIYAQIEMALSRQIPLVHLDSHYHLHTLPCFYQLFLDAAKHYELKIRLAQTYNEGNVFKFKYRQYINNLFRAEQYHYSDYFETVTQFLKKVPVFTSDKVIEIMLHPDFSPEGQLTDHFDDINWPKWLKFLKERELQEQY